MEDEVERLLQWAFEMKDVVKGIWERYEETPDERAAHVEALNAKLRDETGSSLDDMLARGDETTSLQAVADELGTLAIDRDIENENENENEEASGTHHAEEGRGRQNAAAGPQSEGPKPEATEDEKNRMDSIANVLS